MSTTTRTILKDFNRDLLTEQLAASALPFVKSELSGFRRKSRFVGTPTSEPRRVSRILQADGTYTEDFAQPGEIRFEFTTGLTIAEGVILDTLLADHDSTQFTTEQTRENKDETDLDTLITNFPNFDSFNNQQRNMFLKTLARVVLRERRMPPL